MLKRRHPVLLPLALGVVVHVCVPISVYQRHGSVDAFAFRSLDSREYFQIAANLAARGVFSQQTAPPFEPDTWRTPGYPLFLAFFIRLCGESPAVLVNVQQLLSVLNVWLVFRIAGWFMNERRAAVAALLFLFEPYHLFYSLWLMAETLFVTVVLLAWLAWLRAADAGRWPWHALAGALSGAAVLIRPVAVLVPAALLVGLLLAARRRRVAEGPLRWSKWWPGPAAFTVSCGLLIGAWMSRNAVVAGQFAFSDQSGVVLAYFKATEVVLWRDGRTEDRYLETSLDPARVNDPHRVWEDIDTRLGEAFAHASESDRAALRWPNLAQGNRTGLDSFDVSRALGRIGWSYLTEVPLSTLACCLTRSGAVLTFPLELALRPPAGVPQRRLRSLMLAAPYLFLAAAVLVRLLRGNMRFDATYLPLACTAALLLATTPQIDPRFRVPMIPLLIVFALLPATRRRPDARQRQRTVPGNAGAGGATRPGGPS